MTMPPVLELEEISRRVRREHRALHRAIAKVRLGAARLLRGLQDKHALEDEIFALWVRFEEHAASEERLFRALTCGLSREDAAAVHAILAEHVLQRTLFLRTLDLTEPSTLTSAELASVAGRLARTLRADMVIEEALLADLAVRRAHPPDSAAHRSQ